MVIGITIIFLVSIIFVSVLFLGLYMFVCCEDGIKMFSNPKYDERICELEKEIRQLKEGK